MDSGLLTNFPLMPYTFVRSRMQSYPEAMQMQGEFNQAVEMLSEALDDPTWPDHIRPKILQSLSAIAFMEGELT